MKKFQTWFQSLLGQDYMWMGAIFLASLLGTFVSGIILKWGLMTYGDSGFVAKFVVSLGATIAYGGVVLVVFYAFFPETKLVLKRILNKE